MNDFPTTPPALIAARGDDGWEYYELVDPAEMNGQVYWRYSVDWFYTPAQLAEQLDGLPWVLINPEELLAVKAARNTRGCIA